jgi:molybdenum cofactor cytidylyltransferase
MKVSAIVLAAGKSSRMGTNKLLLEVGDKKVIEHILNKLKGYPTIVVTGHNSEEIKPIIDSYGAEEAYNRNYDNGMTTSFQTGILKLAENTDATFLVLSDTFAFKNDLLKRMIEKMDNEDEALLISPLYRGKKGHPVLVRSDLFNEFLNLRSDETMKDVIKKYEEKHKYVEGSVWCRIDLDTPEDFEKVKEMWASRST